MCQCVPASVARPVRQCVLHPPRILLSHEPLCSVPDVLVGVCQQHGPCTDGQQTPVSGGMCDDPVERPAPVGHQAATLPASPRCGPSPIVERCPHIIRGDMLHEGNFRRFTNAPGAATQVSERHGAALKPWADAGTPDPGTGRRRDRGGARRTSSVCGRWWLARVPARGREEPRPWPGELKMSCPARWIQAAAAAALAARPAVCARRPAGGSFRFSA